MKGVLASLLIRLGLDSKEFEQGIGKAKNTTNAFGNGMKRIGGMIAGMFAVGSIIQFGKELINLSGAVEGVRAAFMRMSDTATLDRLKEATSGTVSELDLMKRAVQAQNLGLPIQSLASLFEFATKRAQETGQSVDYLVDSIVLGIGRKSPLILDNLGISAVALKEKLKGAGTETASVADVAKAVGEIAADSMRESGAVIDTNAIKIQSLKAAWDDFKLSLAEDPKLTETVGNWLDGLKRQILLLPESLSTFWKRMFGDPQMFGKGLDNSVEMFSKPVEKATNEEKKQIEVQEKHIQTIGELETEIENLKTKLKTYGINQTAEIAATNAQIQAKEKLLKSLTDTSEAYKLQQELLELQNKTLDESADKLNKLANQYDPTIGLTPKTNADINKDSGMSGDVFDMFPLPDEEAINYDWLNESLKKQLELFEQFKDDFKQLVVDFGTDVVNEFGMAIGEMIATGDFPDDFGKNVLAAIGGFISQLGKMLIGLGVASEAFQKLLASSFLAGGIPLIAAGAGLVLLGAAVSGFAKAGPKATGSASGSVATPSYSGASGSSYNAQNQMQKVIFEIDGVKLKGVLGNVDRKYTLIR